MSHVNSYAQVDLLDCDSLALINSYNPGLSSAWMLQRAMSVRPGKQPDSQFINNLLSSNFQQMEKLGEPVLKPFLQVKTPNSHEFQSTLANCICGVSKYNRHTWGKMGRKCKVLQK